MSSQNNRKDQKESEIPVLCATCAWREFCSKKFSMDNTKPFKCPDYSPDYTLLKKKKESEVDKKED
ncbi:hypothetical protein [Thermodesulfobacterium hydrogeniphilum]|uniref:hypothetical protein n=1 Tax=Thermodesulfobacterium hydrogeniphilum TaxID=161156 RepID=UPI0005711AEA|nr:hypothetical protein [Thermodesulfobacterium hydrogeniphilum]